MLFDSFSDKQTANNRVVNVLLYIPYLSVHRFVVILDFRTSV